MSDSSASTTSAAHADKPVATVSPVRISEIMNDVVGEKLNRQLDEVGANLEIMGTYKAKVKDSAPKIAELENRIAELQKNPKPSKADAASLKTATAELAKLKGELTNGDNAKLARYLELKHDSKKYSENVRRILAGVSNRMVHDLLRAAATSVAEDVKNGVKGAKKTIHSNNVTDLVYRDCVTCGTLLNARLAPRALPVKPKAPKGENADAAVPEQEAKPVVERTDPNYFVLTYSRSFEGGVNNIWTTVKQDAGFADLKLSAEVKSFISDLVVDFVRRVSEFVKLTATTKTIRPDVLLSSMHCLCQANYPDCGDAEYEAITTLVNGITTELKAAKAAAKAAKPVKA